MLRTLALVLGALLMATPLLCSADQSAGYAYDEVEQPTDAGSVPAPGHFAAHYAAVLAASKKAWASPRPGASEEPMLSSTLAQVAAGSVTHVTVMGSLARIENAAAGQAFIVDGTAKRVVILDLTAKTYRTLDIAKIIALTKTPGVANGLPVVHLGSRSIDGVAASGFRTAATSSVRSGCGGFTFSLKRHSVTTAYVDPKRAEPDFPSAAAIITTWATDMLGPLTKELESTLGMDNCTPNVGTPLESARLPVPGFVLYRYVESRTETNVGGGPSVTKTGLLFERGNFTTPSKRDASLFAIPSHFTLQTPVPVPTSSSS